MAPLASNTERDAKDSRRIARTPCRLGGESSREAPDTNPKTRPRHETRNSRVLLLPLGAQVIDGPKFTRRDVRFYLLDQVLATAARRKVLDHLPIPSIAVNLADPHGQRMALIVPQSANGFFDGFDGHIPNLNPRALALQVGRNSAIPISGSLSRRVHQLARYNPNQSWRRQDHGANGYSPH
jgi:hypothetical protein